MILTVDDDFAITEFVSATLTAAGHRVEAFNDARKALDFLASTEPELIISDLMMPAMSGFEFQEAYSKRFPTRKTPFIFMSSLSDTETVVKGLDQGVDDYLVKPVVPEILKAKVRAILKRKQRYTSSLFVGDLSKLPFVNLIKFCELKGLTGEVEITSNDFNGKIRFEAGSIMPDASEGDFDDYLSKFFDLAGGHFAIRSMSVDYGEIESSATAVAEAKKAAAISPKDKPMGQLSGVRVGDRLFQIQTEFVTQPEMMVVTIVVLDGKTVMKKAGDVINDPRREEIERLIREQHMVVEKEVREKLSQAAKRKEENKESDQERFNRLFDEGFDKYRSNDFAGALAAWEKAHAINPSNKTLDINMKIVKKKLEG